MKKKTIQLPRGYLSYSQMSLWMSNPVCYGQLYFDNRDELRVANDGMRYGKEVADALERGEQTGDLLTDAAMLLLPKYDIADKKIEAEFRTPHGWLRCIGRPDSLDGTTLSFIEYKTGRLPWTQRKAQEHLQMHFYATMLYVIYDVVPPTAELVWIETEKGSEGTPRPTGVIRRFPVEITLSKILETRHHIVEVAHEIELAYASHITNPQITTF